MDIIRFNPEIDTRLKEIASIAEEDAVIKPIYSYLTQYGAVRRDVYEFLLQKWMTLHKTDYNFMVEFLSSQAERAWYDLFSRIGQASLVNTLYKREVMEAYRGGIPIGIVTACYEASETPYDMKMAVRASKVMSDEEQHNEVQYLREQLQKAQNEAQHFKEQLQKAQNEAQHFKEQLQKAQDEVKRLRSNYEKEAMEEEREKNVENVVAETDEAEENEEEDVEEDSLGYEATVEEKKKVVRKGKLFQSLRRFRQRASFEKMTEQKKMEELFVLLRQQKYTPKMIRDVRTVIEYGISFDFLYAFVESEVTEKELEALVLFKSPIEE